jgi:hypothetical protein
MEILTKEQLQAIKAESINTAKSGSRKETKAILMEMIKANKGKAIKITPEDVKPHFAEGFTEGLLMELAEEMKVKVMLPKATMITVVRKGNERNVPRFTSAVIEC